MPPLNTTGLVLVDFVRQAIDPEVLALSPDGIPSTPTPTERGHGTSNTEMVSQLLQATPTEDNECTQTIVMPVYSFPQSCTRDCRLEPLKWNKPLQR